MSDERAWLDRFKEVEAVAVRETRQPYLSRTDTTWLALSLVEVGRHAMRPESWKLREHDEAQVRATWGRLKGFSP